MKKISQSRRDFLQQSALAAAAFTIIPGHLVGCRPTGSANDVLNIGFIGTGQQSQGLFERFAALPGVHVFGASDVDQIKLENFKKGANRYYAEITENENYSDFKTFPDYRELINHKNIHAVVIATPDHWHAIQAIDAMKAGKDVYCEKPLAHTLYEGRQIVETANKLGRVLQTGSMQRSSPGFRKACELVSNGYVGEISKVLVNVGDPALKCDLPAEATPETIDWDRWVGPSQMRPYSPVLAHPIGTKGWAAWREYREFGGGILSDWGAHMFDIAQWGLEMDETGPVKYFPPEDPAAKRGLQMFYANGIEMVHENFERGWAVRFIGSEGSLDVSRQFLDSKPEIIAQSEIKAGDKRLYLSENHYQDWVDAIRNRTKPITHAEIGHRTSSICNIANIAYQLNRPLDWDPAAEEFKGDEEANALRTKVYREPYSL